VADLQALAQAVDGQGRADQIGETKHEEFEMALVLDALERRHVFADEPAAVLAGPAACFDGAASEERLGKLSSNNTHGGSCL
jgi:hypothetical protein